MSVLSSLNGDFQAFVEVGHLADAFGQGIEIIVDLAEDLFIGQEGDGGAGAFGFADFLSPGW